MAVKPVLVIMAAGMGSRFGGLKQMTPIDDAGQVIIDYSIYDAKRAGFETIVCIIKKEMEQDFEQLVGKRIRPFVELKYAFQRQDALPNGYSIPIGRVKPWGTAHAVLCAKDEIGNAPFAVLNADDFYGASAFGSIYDYLAAPHGKTEHAMVGYLLRNTLSDSGSVARGVCNVDENGKLATMDERLKVIPYEGEAAYSEDEGKSWVKLSGDTPVSMNLFGFMPSIMDELQQRFPPFLDKNLPINPLKCEYLLPRVADELVHEGKASFTVLHSADSWHGMTYREDLPLLEAALTDMKREGKYPNALWR